MTTTTLHPAATPNPLPPIRPLLNLRANPSNVSHPGLRERTETMLSARVAANAAIAEHERLSAPALLEAAHAADVAALGTAAVDGEYRDPGTPNVDALLVDRAAAHRKAYALQNRAAESINEWLDYLSEHQDAIEEHIRAPRDRAARKVTAVLTKALPDITAIHDCDAEIAWLRGALEDPRLNRVGPQGQYFVSHGPRPADSPILAQVEALLASLDDVEQPDTDGQPA